MTAHNAADEIEIVDENYGIFTAACPECGAEFRAKGEERAIENVQTHLETCGEFEHIKVNWTGYARGRISEYNASYDSRRADHFLSAVGRQKTNIVIATPQEAASVIEELGCYHSSQRTWMNASMDRSVQRVRSVIRSEMEDRGYTRGDSRFSVFEEVDVDEN